jgi:hypothetical protein
LPAYPLDYHYLVPPIPFHPFLTAADHPASSCPSTTSTKLGEEASLGSPLPHVQGWNYISPKRWYMAPTITPCLLMSRSSAS